VFPPRTLAEAQKPDGRRAPFVVTRWVARCWLVRSGMAPAQTTLPRETHGAARRQVARGRRSGLDIIQLDVAAGGGGGVGGAGRAVVAEGVLVAALVTLVRGGTPLQHVLLAVLAGAGVGVEDDDKVGRAVGVGVRVAPREPVAVARPEGLHLPLAVAPPVLDG